MKRPLLIIAAFLLAGAVVNVAVAWVVALAVAWSWTPGQPIVAAEQTAVRLEGDRYRFWRVDVHRRWASVRVVSAWLDPSFEIVFTGGGTVNLVYSDEGPPPASLAPRWAGSVIPGCDGDDFHCRVTTAYGWPRSALRCTEIQSAPQETLPQANIARKLDHGIPLPFGAPLPALPAGSQMGRFVASVPQGSVPFYPQAARMVPLAPIWSGLVLNTIFYAALLWLLIPGPFALRRLLRLRRGLCPKCAYPMGESEVCTECGGALLPGHSLRG